ncbi:MAG: cytochrome c, partial [Nevskia sp.]|nr:cytochrome c [Nevskia sp.]
MRRESAAVYVFIAGVGYFFLAVLTLVILPYLAPVNNASAVKDVGTGRIVTVRPYTAQELQGRQVYIREGCFYCHSQYVRPLADEVRRYGPVSQIGEYAHDVPHLFGTSRVGPDLAREGGKVSDGWHYAHLYAPRLLLPDSIMPAYPWLFAGIDARGRARPTPDGQALVAYLQKLGTDLGDWREQFGSLSSDTGGGEVLPAGALHEGRAVYRQRCLSCHGVNGDGRGPAASLLHEQPTDFTRAVFEFRSTPAGTLPTDGDLYRTVTRGLPGTAMPPGHTLAEKDRWYLVQVIKTFSPRWEK